MTDSTMMPADPTELLAESTTRLPIMLDEISTLIACESPSADLEAVARSARMVSQVGTDRLGVAPEKIVIEGRTHLRWQFGEQPRVVVLCHHDTVWPLGSLTAHPIRCEEGVLRGPGCLDMKAGVVMALHALTMISNRSGVTLLVTGDEEIGSPTSRDLIEATARGCRAALVLEAAANGGGIKVQRKGRAHYSISITGRAAHAGLEPERGVNAAVEMAHHVLAMGSLADPPAGTTVTPSLVVSGTSANTVPERGSFSVDVRASTQSELERVDAEIRALKPRLDGAHIEVTGSIDRPPMERAAAEHLFALAQRRGTSIGYAGTGAAVGGGSDGNLTAALGVPTLDGLGAAGGGPHTPDEHVLVDELPRRTALIALLLEAMLRDDVSSEVEPVAKAERS